MDFPLHLVNPAHGTIHSSCHDQNYELFDYFVHENKLQIIFNDIYSLCHLIFM